MSSQDNENKFLGVHLTSRKADSFVLISEIQREGRRFP